MGVGHLSLKGAAGKEAQLHQSVAPDFPLPVPGVPAGNSHGPRCVTGCWLSLWWVRTVGEVPTSPVTTATRLCHPSSCCPVSAFPLVPSHCSISAQERTRETIQSLPKLLPGLLSPFLTSERVSFPRSTRRGHNTGSGPLMEVGSHRKLGQAESAITPKP